MRRISIIIGLELYAFIVTLLRLQVGINTDEAKYLLNIPYPHPPLARYILHLFDGFVFQEFLFRFLFASLLAQAVWILWGMAKRQSCQWKITLCITWLCTTAVFLQAGTVMMAPLTALQGLVLLAVWVQSLDKPLSSKSLLLCGLWWLLSLFTAIQAVLFAPIMLAILWRSKKSLSMQFVYLCLPVAALIVYMASNPLTVAILTQYGGGTHVLTERLISTALTIMVGGGWIAAILGTVGVIYSRKIELIALLLIVMLYIFVGRHTYYAILITPVFFTGLLWLPKTIINWRCMWAMPMISMITLTLHWPIVWPNKARDVRDALQEKGIQHSIVIHGPFGHEWQYYLPRGTKPLTDTVPNDETTIVCKRECPRDITEGRQRVQVGEVAVYLPPTQ